MEGTAARPLPSAGEPVVTRVALRGRRRDRVRTSKRNAKGVIDGLADGACVVPAFVAGPENRLVARVMNTLVGDGDGAPFDEAARPHGPLTLVGPSGCGKTHLAHGLAELWHAAFGASGDRRGVAYFTASDFSRQLANAIDDGAVNDFRQQLRGCGLLVIDDLDRLSGSAHLQEELLHTIDAVADAGGWIVFATATLPADTPALGRPLVGRLAQGLVLEIAPLGVEARGELLRDVAAALGCRLDSAALATLAGRLPGGPPMVVGAGVELRRRFGRRINAADAERFLADSGHDASPPLSDILAAVARYYGVTQRVLTSASRKQTAVLARAVAIHLARTLTPLSYQEIGRVLGGRDHTTILHNFRRIENALPKDRALRSAIEDLKRSLSP